MKPDARDRFASKLTTLDDVPAPLGMVIRGSLKREDSIQLLVFGPANKTMGVRSPATVLAVLGDGWVLANDDEEGHATVVRSDFTNTLLLELTIILLYGKLRIVFTREGSSQFVEMEFNTVMKRLYSNAVQRLLNGMTRTDAAAPIGNDAAPAESIRRLPLKFKNALAEYKPTSELVLELVHAPAVFTARKRWLQRELAPEAMLMLNERELTLISDEKTRSRMSGSNAKYGSIVTYCPLSRLRAFQLVEKGPVAVLALSVSANGTEEPIRFTFPPERRGAVEEMVLHALQQKERCQKSEPESAGPK